MIPGERMTLWSVVRDEPKRPWKALRRALPYAALLEGHQVCGAWSRSTSPPPTEGHVPEPQEERATLRLHFSPASGTGLIIALPWGQEPSAGFGGEVTAVARLPGVRQLDPPWTERGLRGRAAT
jgi:hypothetical protein